MGRFLVFFVFVFGIALNVFLSRALLPMAAAAVCNPGIVFGIAVPQYILVFGSLLFLGGVFWFVVGHLKTLSTMEHAGYGLLLSGGILNLYERVFWACVQDFLPVGFGIMNNPADWYITLGTGILVVYYVRKDS